MEDTLLMMFIALVAFALIIIAVGIGLVAWYLSIFLGELTLITRRLHEAGELVAEDLSELRQAVKGGGTQFIYHIAKNIWPNKKTIRKSPPPQE